MNQEIVMNTGASNIPSNIYTIVVSDRTFHVSWKSLVSDGPENFFTRHFMNSKNRTIHIDRSPEIFEIIIRHLRGYPVIARNEREHQDLLNDSQYYGLNKLFKILNQFVFINVGESTFRLKWELFNKDGPHNYFTGPLKHSLHSPHPRLGESAPMMIQRDPEAFKDIIKHLQGYSIHVRDEEHRLKLLSDAQFYLLRKLRDKLCTVTTEEHTNSEILVHIQDIRPSFIRISEKDSQVRYMHEKKLYRLMVQINDMNAAYHRMDKEDLFLLEGGDITLIKDKQWSVSKHIEFDKDCAVVIQPDVDLRLQDYLNELKIEEAICQEHENCWISWFAIERAISSMTIYPNTISKLLMTVKKAQVVRSKKQANLKRKFLA